MRAHAAAGSRFVVRWSLACAAGELLGIAAAAGAAAMLATRMAEPATAGEKALTLALMVAAGVLEGTLVGTVQWRVLRRRFPTVPVRDWIGATAAVAAAGWSLGMLPSLLQPAPAADAPAPELPLATVGVLALGFGLLAGAMFGAGQWMVLRRHARHAGRWIVANALGWGAGITWIYLAAAVVEPGTATTTVAATGALAGVAAGLTLGLVTGLFLLRIHPRTGLQR